MVWKGALFFLCGCCVLLVSGCSVSYRLLLGVDTSPQWRSHSQIEKDFKRYRIKQDAVYVLDTASYTASVRARVQPIADSLMALGLSKESDTVLRAFKPFKDDMQPVQLRYFAANGQPITKMVNCYLHPPIPMRWNVDGLFNQFPPAHNIAMLNNHQQPLAYFLPHVKDLQGQSVSLPIQPETEYVALVMFNRYMIRPSRKLIKSLKDYHQQHPQAKVQVFFIHNHNSQLWMMYSPEQQAAVKVALQEMATKQPK
jgi:hypothetical protein